MSSVTFYREYLEMASMVPTYKENTMKVLYYSVVQRYSSCDGYFDNGGIKRVMIVKSKRGNCSVYNCLTVSSVQTVFRLQIKFRALVQFKKWSQLLKKYPIIKYSNSSSQIWLEFLMRILIITPITSTELTTFCFNSSDTSSLSLLTENDTRAQ